VVDQKRERKRILLRGGFPSPTQTTKSKWMGPAVVCVLSVYVGLWPLTARRRSFFLLSKL
jgi:hypothetical protein